MAARMGVLVFGSMVMVQLQALATRAELVHSENRQAAVLAIALFLACPQPGALLTGARGG